MTREEAIKVLNMVEAHGLAEEAKQMAIQALNSLEEVYAKGYNDGFTQAEVNFENDKALSQEPTDENLHREREQAYMQGYEDASKRFRQEPCDDLISREAVIEILEDYGCTNREGLIFKDIRALPSVTHKSGKWVLLDECANSGYYCSNCQKKLVKEGWSQTVKKIKFCPNCGARMVEPQESENKDL